MTLLLIHPSSFRLHPFLRSRLAVAAAILTAGCNLPAILTAPFKQEPEPAPAIDRNQARAVFGSDEGSQSDGDPIRVHLQFDVARIELPAGPVRHAAKVWNHVDELQIDPVLSALLDRNGIRIGVASASSWPALRALFSEEGAKVGRAQRVVQSGAPLWLGLERIVEDQSIFFYGSNGRLAGKTFQKGTKCLRIDYQVEYADDLQVTLTVTPEIQNEETSMHWRPSEQGYYLSVENERRVFNELRSSWRLRPSDFLVIGPSNATRLDQLLGSRLLTRQTKGDRFDMILCVTPKPFRLE